MRLHSDQTRKAKKLCKKKRSKCGKMLKEVEDSSECAVERLETPSAESESGTDTRIYYRI